MSFVNSIVDKIKDNIGTSIAVFLGGIIISVGGWFLSTFQEGAQAQAEEKFSKMFTKEMTKFMTSPVRRDIYVKELIKDTNVVSLKKQASLETQKAIVEMTQGDSINLRKELRLYMDLRESERVSEEIGKMYREHKRFLQRLDSVLTNHYDLRRRSNTHIVL